MSKKFKLDFEDMQRLMKNYEQLGGQMKPLVEDCLKATFDYVTPGIESAIAGSKFNFGRTGKTKGSLRKTAVIEWSGTKGAVPVGFDIDNGGIASIFLMHGTPKITPDRNLYNSIFGTKVRKAVAEVQREKFLDAIDKVMG